MPYKSDAQRKAFHAMLSRGEISQKTVDEWDRKSKGKKLPEHVRSKAAEAGMRDATALFGGIGDNKVTGRNDMITGITGTTMNTSGQGVLQRPKPIARP